MFDHLHTYSDVTYTLCFFQFSSDNGLIERRFCDSKCRTCYTIIIERSGFQESGHGGGGYSR